MNSAFQDRKTCKVLTVDTSGPVRQMMAETLRSTLGFELAEGRASIAEAVQQLETEKVDWIILPLGADQPVNAIHLLKICSENPPLKTTRVSIFVDQEEEYVLPLAFELGLFSWHIKPFTKETYSEELKQLLAEMSEVEFKDLLISAKYFRKYLREKKSYAQQLVLEKGLLDIYPADTDILLNLVEPLYHTGKSDSARSILTQVAMIDPAKKGQLEELAGALFGDNKSLEAEGEAGQNILGLGQCIVIDSDDSVRASMTEILFKFGVMEIQDFANGAEAWEVISKLETEPSMIFMEWRIPGVTGPILLQRIRHHGFYCVPIVVVSSLLQAEDLPLTREIGISNILKKPLRIEDFISTLIWTVQQERMPTEHQSMERKIRAAIKAGKKEVYEPLVQEFLTNPNISEAKKKLIEGELFFHKGDYIPARNSTIESIKMAGDSILGLNLLGKCFMSLKDYLSAQKCFEKAQKLSPMNIERICNLAEVKSELGDVDAAQEHLEKANLLDRDAKIVQEAGVKVAIAAGNTELAKNLMQTIDSLGSLVAYLNNKAVAYAKVGKPEEAIEMYLKTEESIPDDQTELKGIVAYNRALALVKSGEIEKSIEILGGIEKMPLSKISKKAKSLKERLSAALKKGQSFKLNVDGSTKTMQTPPSTEEASVEEQNNIMLQSLSIVKGELCCYLVFKNPEKNDVRGVSLLAKPPRFQFRSTIEKQGQFPPSASGQ
jgi:tetratricopeptide (TPR) repeat protein